MKNVTLLLTGTVNPQGMTFTKLVDPEDRAKQYLAGVKFWLENTTLPIVFVENSETDLSSQIEPKYKDRIEFLTFDGNQTKHKGKGYGEFNCLRYAAEHSTFYKSSDFVFKVTGRLKLLNFARFYKHYLSENEIFVFADLQKNLRMADSRMFGFHPDFLTHYLLKRQEQLDDSTGRIFEFVLAKAIHEAIIDELTFAQFPFYPELVGMSASAGKNYKSNYLYFFAKHIQLYLKKRFMEMSAIK